MAAPNPAAGTGAAKQITYLATTLRAPPITETATRLSDQARDADCTHKDNLAADPDEKSVPATPPAPTYGSAQPDSVPSRPWRTSTSTPNPPSADMSGRRARFFTEARKVVSLAPPGTGQAHLATALGVAAPHRPPRRRRHPQKAPATACVGAASTASLASAPPPTKPGPRPSTTAHIPSAQTNQFSCAFDIPCRDSTLDGRNCLSRTGATAANRDPVH